jgi:hypothetical protein
LIAIETRVAAVTVRMVDPLIEPDVAVIVAVPCPTVAANPVVAPILLIVAVVGVSEVHCTVEVRFCVLPSVYVPVAVNCSVGPTAIEGVAGVIAIVTRAAAVTVSTVDPLIEPDVAVIVAVPCPTVVANPVVAPVLLIVAVVGVSEVHCTVAVMFCVLPSVYVPVAVNSCGVSCGSVGIAGVTAIDTNTAAVIVTVVEPLVCPDVALILVLPEAAPLATPWAFTDAMLEFPLIQVAVAVRSNVLPSEYVPVAVSCCVVPRAKDGFTGVTAIETKVGAAGLTVCVSGDEVLELSLESPP